jgi:hypothetical protein
MPDGSTQTAAEALDLRESISLTEAASAPQITKPDGTVVELGYDGTGNKVDGGVFDAKGRVPLHIIRPGIGKGRGRHLYEAKMLEEAAPNFEGWKMFLNHLSPEAKKAAGGLPRDIRDSGGRVQEAWWDDSVKPNAEAGHGQGAVMGMVRPVKFIRNLIDDDPELAEASISASATGVRQVTHEGQRCWLVEGINPRGSVDWVTEAGAGGRIVPMLEEAYADENDQHEALLESMSDDEIRAHLEEARPELLQEAGKGGDAEDDPAKGGDGGKDELEEKVKELVGKGLPRAAAEKAARKALAESTEGEDVPVTKEEIAEAIKDSPDVLVEAATQSGPFQVFLSSLVESKIEEERDTIRAESRADVDRAFQLAKMERTAHAMIAESKLPESWQTDLKAKFSLDEATNEPAPALDVTDEVDDDGKLVKPALDRLREAVAEEIKREGTRLREASTTRVRSGVTQLSEARSAKETPKEGEEEQPKPAGEKPYWAQTLAEAGIPDPEKAYALEG